MPKFQIPAERLGRHAYHQIVTEDGACRVTMGTRVHGTSLYVSGVAEIISVFQRNRDQLENRAYETGEFIDHESIY